MVRLVILTLLAYVTAGLEFSSPAFAVSISQKNAASQYREQGLAYRQQERFPEAIAALKKSVALDPQDTSGFIVLGWTLHLAAQDTLAATSLWQALYLDPFSTQACNALGIVYLVQGELSQSVLVHNWAAFLKPDNEIAAYNLSLAYHRQKAFDWAIAHANRAAELEPSNPHPFVAKAVVYWDQGDRTAALQAYRQATSLDSRYKESAFLNYLKEAGFSLEQIQISKQILSALGKS